MYIAGYSMPNGKMEVADSEARQSLRSRGVFEHESCDGQAPPLGSADFVLIQQSYVEQFSWRRSNFPYGLSTTNRKQRHQRDWHSHLLLSAVDTSLSVDPIFVSVTLCNLIKGESESLLGLLCIRSPSLEETTSSILVLMVTNLAYTVATFNQGFGDNPSLTLLECVTSAFSTKASLKAVCKLIVHWLCYTY